MVNTHCVRLWRGGVGKEDQQEKLAVVELLKSCLHTVIPLYIITSAGPAHSISTCRSPAWHVWGLIAADMPVELRCRERTDFHAISCRGAPK